MCAHFSEARFLIGMAVIISSAVIISEANYPGWEVLFPVLGTAMVITGGATVPKFGTEAVLGIRPMMWVGRHSYSLYLWHWPLLIIVAAAHPVSSMWDVRGFAFGLTIVASVVTYRFVENPLRALDVGSSITIGAGLAVTVLVIVGLSIVIAW